MRTPPLHRLVAVAALALATAAQWRFSFEPKSLAAGSWLWLGAAMLAILALGRRPLSVALDLASPEPDAPPSSPPPARSSVALALGGLVLGAVVVVMVDRSEGRHWPSFIVWVGALFAYFLAFALPDLRMPRTIRWSRAATIAVAAFTAVGFAIRAWDLGSIPWSIGGDEASQGMEALRFLEGSRSDVFGLGWLSVPNLLFAWTALFLGALSDDVVAMRLSYAVIGTLTLPGFYLLAKRLFDRELAIVATLLLAGFHFHVHYSRLGSVQIGDPFFSTWALYLLITGIERSSRARWVAAGIVSGVAFYAYAGSRQVPVVLAGAVLAFAVSDRRRLRGQRGHVLATVGAFAIAIGPMALVAIQHPDDFNARLNQIGIFQSGWLDKEVAVTGRSAESLLLQQFERAFLSYNFHPDRVAWYGISTPLMDFPWSVAFGLGFWICVARLGDWRAGIPLGWFASVITLGGALTENPPSSMRLVGSAAPAVLFVAIALRFLSSEWSSLLPRAVVVRRTVTAMTSLALVAVSMHFYFVTYQRSWTYGWANTELATRLGYYLRELGPGWREYFYGAPRIYAKFATMEFLARETELVDVLEPRPGLPDDFDGSGGTIFVFVPERRRELDAVRAALPNGELEVVRRLGTVNGPELFVAYRVPAGRGSPEP